MKKLGELHVAEVMTPNPLTALDTDRLTNAIRIFESNRFSAIPVVDSTGSCVGIISLADLADISHEIQSDLAALSQVSETTQNFLIRMLIDQGETTLIQDVMTSPTATTTPSTNLVVAARMLHENGYRHLPVVDENNHPIGILSTTDIVGAVSQLGAITAG